jgi:methylated-DNA-[protein]-cysteine S-methyltransferase
MTARGTQHHDVSYARIDTPVASLTIVAGERGLRAVLFAGDPAPADAVEGRHPLVTATVRQLEEYFAGERREFDLPLDVSGTAFQRRAWLALASIPYGTILSYGEQARRLGAPGAARAVGSANARNPMPIVLPCHRLVGADGSLTGYGGGLDVKRALLAHEAQVVGAGSGRVLRSPPAGPHAAAGALSRNP